MKVYVAFLKNHATRTEKILGVFQDYHAAYDKLREEFFIAAYPTFRSTRKILGNTSKTTDGNHTILVLNTPGLYLFGYIEEHDII